MIAVPGPGHEPLRDQLPGSSIVCKSSQLLPCVQDEFIRIVFYDNW